MPSAKSLVISLVAAAAVFVTDASAQCLQQPQQRFQPQMASGYQARAIFSGLQQPRHMVVDSQGALLIASMGPVGIQHFRFSDSGGTNICVSAQRDLITNTNLNHGIALSVDSRTLYVSTATQVISYPYDPVAVTVGSPRTLINIPAQGGFHQQRTLFIPRDSPNTLIVHVGSEDNLDTATTDPQSGRSMIRAFNLNTLGNSGPVAYNSGSLYGWGMRNSVGIGENPVTGEIWTVDNGLDNMMRSGRDVHNESPGEKLNFHGRVSDTQGALYGANFGHPRCHPVWDTSVIPGFEVGSQVIQGNPSGEVTDQYCQTQPTPPRLTFASHTAPLDIKFTPDGRSAYITFHGSWNRTPPDGYRLSRVDFGPDGQPIHARNSRTAEVRVMQNPNNNDCPSGCFRPTGLAWDPRQSGRIFMTSDSTGELYVVTGLTSGTNPPGTTTTVPGTTTRIPSTTTTTTTQAPPSTPTANCQPLWGQCGGNNWTGGRCCQQGTCRFQNDWYSQCLN